MDIVLVDLGSTFPNPKYISDLKDWEVLETFTENEGPKSVLAWKIVVSMVKSMLTQVRDKSFHGTPLVVTTPTELYQKLKDIFGAGHNVFWAKSADMGFRFRMVSILATNGASSAILIEIPEIEGGLYVIAHIGNIES